MTINTLKIWKRNRSVAGYLAGACVALLVTSIYWPGLHGSFFFDDGPNILDTEGVKLESLSIESLLAAARSGTAGPSGRPVSQLSFALNYYLGGFNPLAFKAINLAIHLLTGVTVFFLLLRLIHVGAPVSESSRGNNGKFFGAGVLTVIWLLHPIQLLPVLHVVQRMTSLSALFMLAALLLYIQARERSGVRSAAMHLLAWTVLWPLSFLSKETGALFPLFVLGYELILRRHTHGELDSIARTLGLIGIVAAGATAIYMLSPAGQWLWVGYGARSFSMLERLMTESRVLWFYLGLIVFPRLGAFGTYHDDISVSTHVLSPWTTLPSVMGIICLLWIAWWTRRRLPVISLGIVWFFAGHALESTVLPLELAHEHRNYVPLLGVLLAAAGIAHWVATKKTLSSTIVAPLVSVILVYLIIVTAMRSHQYGNEVRHTQIEAQYHPESPRAHYAAGRAMTRLGLSNPKESPALHFARYHYEQAGTVDAEFKLGWLGLIHLDCLSGRKPEQSSVRELSQRLASTPFAPGDITILHHISGTTITGTLCMERPDVEQVFAAAISNPTVPDYTRAILHSWAADFYALGQRDLTAARTELEKSLALSPHISSTRLKLAQLAFLQGRYAESRAILELLRTESLTKVERITLKGLMTCLENDDAAARCAPK